MDLPAIQKALHDAGMTSFHRFEARAHEEHIEPSDGVEVAVRMYRQTVAGLCQLATVPNGFPLE